MERELSCGAPQKVGVDLFSLSTVTGTDFRGRKKTNKDSATQCKLLSLSQRIPWWMVFKAVEGSRRVRMTARRLLRVWSMSSQSHDLAWTLTEKATSSRIFCSHNANISTTFPQKRRLDAEQKLSRLARLNDCPSRREHTTASLRAKRTTTPLRCY